MNLCSVCVAHSSTNDLPLLKYEASIRPRTSTVSKTVNQWTNILSKTGGKYSPVGEYFLKNTRQVIVGGRMPSRKYEATIRFTTSTISKMRANCCCVLEDLKTKATRQQLAVKRMRRNRWIYWHCSLLRVLRGELLAWRIFYTGSL